LRERRRVSSSVAVTRRAGAAWMVLLAFVAVGIGASCERLVYLDDARSIADGCVQLGLSTTRCHGLVAEARETLDLVPEEIADTQVLIEDRCGDRREQVCTRSGGFVGGVLFRLTDGKISWTSVTCLPGSTTEVCIQR
jgi:hypothetical protein